ncbi:hypothetical protein CEXT_271411 [Caerostris extrusa]|uniref:Uncharacterized protein n=1 Tax=Caerostris extrusa TaxID=172846 RepID=A0AAV4U1U4_CAEEX|nr:hypothetical protein CEXT_271411 [Caerostris extrusa]
MVQFQTVQYLFLVIRLDVQMFVWFSLESPVDRNSRQTKTSCFSLLKSTPSFNGLSRTNFFSITVFGLISMEDRDRIFIALPAIIFEFLQKNFSARLLGSSESRRAF